MKQISFALQEKNETDSVFSLIRQHVQWMDSKGIRQWNAADYLSAYPRSYYAEQQASAKEKLFVRLDCAIDHPFLNSYCESQGYESAGTCTDGPYIGS